VIIVPVAQDNAICIMQINPHGRSVVAIDRRLPCIKQYIDSVMFYIKR
jgi:hypothetical protein